MTTQLVGSVNICSFLIAAVSVLSSTFAFADNDWRDRHERYDCGIVIHLKHHTEDLQAAITAVGLGTNLANSGCETTLFLTLRGVRVADARLPQNLLFGRNDLGAITLEDVVADFQAAGGAIAVCPPCAAQVGLTNADLIPGATIPTAAEVARLFQKSDAVIDF